MRIRIELEDTDPPRGKAFTPSRERQTFAGWLELIRVLQELIGSTEDGDSPSNAADQIRGRPEPSGPHHPGIREAK